MNEPSKPSIGKAYYSRWIVCVVIAAAVTAGMVIRHRSGETVTPEMDLWSVLFFFVSMAVLVPLMVLGVIGMQTLNTGMTGTPRPWARPRLQDNPLQMRNPLKVVHFLAQLFLVAGAVMTLTGLWAGQAVLLQGLMALWFGVLMYIGVRLSEKVYARRMMPAQ